MRMLVSFKNKIGNIPRPNDSNLVLQVTSHHDVAACLGYARYVAVVNSLQKKIDLLHVWVRARCE
jgi:hypothetical protein